MNDKQAAFCQQFARLYREASSRGELHPRVGTKAALAAGYGGESKHPLRQKQAAEVAYTRLIKQVDVVDYIEQLGVEREGDVWRLVSVNR
jgi:hypothetical protein